MVTAMQAMPLDAFRDKAPLASPLTVTSISERVMVGGDIDFDWQSLCQRRCQQQVARVYPQGARVSSDNMDAFIAYRAGCQMVALNMQTNDLPMQLNSALFQLDGGFGYILKPKESSAEDWVEQITEVMFDNADDDIPPDDAARDYNDFLAGNNDIVPSDKPEDA